MGTLKAEASLILIEVIDIATVTNGARRWRTGEDALLRSGWLVKHRSGGQTLMDGFGIPLAWSKCRIGTRWTPDGHGLLILLIDRGVVQTRLRLIPWPSVILRNIVEIRSGGKFPIVGMSIDVRLCLSESGSDDGCWMLQLGTRLWTTNTIADPNIFHRGPKCLIKCMVDDSVAFEFLLLHFQLLLRSN